MPRTKNHEYYLNSIMQALVYLSVAASILGIIYWLTKMSWLAVGTFTIVGLIISLYIYVSVHIIYKYYWYFNGGKLLEERQLDMSFVKKSSLITLLMIVYAILGLVS